MNPLRVTIIDMVTSGPTKRGFSRIMNPNYASIMPQVIAVWAEEMGHQVAYECYTGQEDITSSLPSETDVLFLGAFTRSAQAAYAISNIYRKAGAVTVLGGPHARCYPEDSAKYFDYVLGLTDKAEVEHILTERAPGDPIGQQLSALRQPTYLPGVRERWKFIAPTIAKAPLLKIVPMIGSMGCPYTCSFCIDSVLPYQTLGFDQIKEDLRFLKSKLDQPMVGWHDPNFGVRFDDYMTAIEDAVEPGSVRFVAESSLSLLSEDNLKRMKKNGVVGMLPGIESWYDYGNKSKATRHQGMEKVKLVSDHVNMILSYIPYVQTNFVLGLDCDDGAEPFELTKRFIDLTPGAYTAFSLLTCYGRAAPMNLDLQRDGRVLPFPFHFLDSNHATNVTPLNYEWPEFYRLVADLTKYTLSVPRMAKRFRVNSPWTAKWLNLVRAGTSSRAKYQAGIGRMLREDSHLRGFFEGAHRDIPGFYTNGIKSALGPLWDALPDGALLHDHNAYLNTEQSASRVAAE